MGHTGLTYIISSPRCPSSDAKNPMCQFCLFCFQLRIEGLIVTDNRSSIHLPAETFKASQDSRVITVVYLTLNDVLTLNKENDEYSDLAPPANTTVVSSTVHPRPPAVLNDPVKIVLQNRKVFKLFLS